MNVETDQNRYAPPKADVSDYVDPNASVEPAGRGARFGAAMIDMVIFIALSIPMISTLGLASDAPLDPQEISGIAMGATLLGIVVVLGVTAVLVHRNGQTIGKKLVGIKVVRRDGTRASLGRIFWLRNFVNGIPGAIPLLGYLYVLTDHLFIFGDHRQCLHDKIADTIVVNA